MKRKELKRIARGNLKKHYFFLVAVCLIWFVMQSDFGARLFGGGNDSYEKYADRDYYTVEELREAGVPEEEITNAEDITIPAMISELVDLFVVSSKGLARVCREMLIYGRDSAAELADSLQRDAIVESMDHKVLGRSRGAFASMLNTLASGRILISFTKALNTVFRNDRVSLLIIIIAICIMKYFLWSLIIASLKIVRARMFMEARIYERIPLHRLLFLIRERKWFKASWIMFVKWVYSVLWQLTIIGGIIKYFSYYMVPYIAAENPNITAREAITLSRKMMYGHKIECMKIELSFIGWHFLNLFTGGLLNIFYLSPYLEATRAEYAVYIRECAKVAELEGVEMLNDRYLYEKAEYSVLADYYGDVMTEVKDAEHFVDRRKGIKKFLSDTFGLILVNDEAEQAYQKHQAEAGRFRVFKAEAEGIAYPIRLSPVPQKKIYDLKPEVRYLRAYSIWSLILMFFIMSFVGWLWEVSIHIVQDGTFVNRGVMHGPWLPIYGFGCVLILLALYRFRKNPLLEFVTAVLLCGAVEYLTSVYLEAVHGGQKWWDYEGYFFNLNGRVCAEGLLIFGLGGCGMVYFLAPNIEGILSRINKKILIAAAIILMAVFIGDQIYSSKHPNAGEGITDYTPVRIEDYLEPGGQNTSAESGASESSEAFSIESVVEATV